MKYFNKQSFCYKIVLSGLLFILLFYLASSTSTAKKNVPSVFAGFLIDTLTPELAEDQGLPQEQRGVVVLGIFQGSVAEKAGLQEGDVIVQVQNNKGKTVDITDASQYQTIVDSIPEKKAIVLTILREGKRQGFELMRSSDTLGPIKQPTPAAASQTIKVSADGTGDCKSIYGALLRSRPGDTVLLKPGKYDSINITRNQITLAAFDPQNPPDLTGIFINSVTGVKVSGLIVIPDKSQSSNNISTGVTINFGKQINLANCRIQGFTYGIAINSSTGISVEANVIAGNWAGIYIDDLASDIKITHNLIRKNCGLGGINAGGSVEIVNNTILENRVANDQFCNQVYQSNGKTVLGAGITIRSGNSTIYNNIIGFNNVGCLIAPTSQTTLEYNDVYQHQTDSSAMHRAYEDIQIKGSISNFLSLFIYESTPAPLFPISASGKTTLTPALKFQPSSTNITSDPFFLDSQKGDYRLATDSPLIGKGRGGSYIGAYPPITPKQEAETTNKQPVFGISARPLTDSDRKTSGLTSLNGLWITEVKKSSLAEKLQIKVDDVIMEINGTAFKDSEEFKKLITAAPVTTVKVFRGGAEIVLTLPTEF